MTMQLTGQENRIRPSTWLTISIPSITYISTTQNIIQSLEVKTEFCRQNLILKMYKNVAVDKNHRLFTPQINNISLRMPPSPLLHQFGDLPLGTLCNESTVSNCGTEFCDCTYTLNVALGSLVELVLIDEGLYP